MRHHGGDTSSLVVYQHALGAYANAGQWDRALALLSTMSKQQLTPTLECYELVLQACQRASRPKKALVVWTTMIERHHLRPNTACLNAIVGCCALGGNLEDALDILKDWKALGDPRTYELVLEGCAKEKDWRRALSVLGAMRVPPDAGCYAAVITACAEGDQWEKCISLLREMRMQGVEPQEGHYLIAMQVCAKAGKVDKVVGLLQEMKDEVDLTEGALVPEEGHYQTCMWACLNHGDAKQAIQLFSEMESRGIRPYGRSYKTLLHAYRTLQDGGRALETLRRMKKEGLAAGRDPNVFSGVFGLLCQLGKYGRAAEMIEGASNEELEGVSGLFANEVKGMIDAGRGRECVAWMRTFHQKGLKQGKSGPTWS